MENLKKFKIIVLIAIILQLVFILSKNVEFSLSQQASSDDTAKKSFSQKFNESLLAKIDSLEKAYISYNEDKKDADEKDADERDTSVINPKENIDIIQEELKDFFVIYSDIENKDIDFKNMLDSKKEGLYDVISNTIVYTYFENDKVEDFKSCFIVNEFNVDRCIEEFDYEDEVFMRRFYERMQNQHYKPNEDITFDMYIDGVLNEKFDSSTDNLNTMVINTIDAKLTLDKYKTVQEYSFYNKENYQIFIDSFEEFESDKINYLALINEVINEYHSIIH